MGDSYTALADHTLSFGPFRLFPNQRLLMEGEKSLHVGSRALEILIALIEQAGVVVSTQDLLKRIWPDSRARPLRPCPPPGCRASMVKHCSFAENYAYILS